MLNENNDENSRLLREINLSENQKKIIAKYKKKFQGENTKFKGYF